MTALLVSVVVLCVVAAELRHERKWDAAIEAYRQHHMSLTNRN